MTPTQHGLAPIVVGVGVCVALALTHITGVMIA